VSILLKNSTTLKSLPNEVFGITNRYKKRIIKPKKGKGSFKRKKKPSLT